MLTNLHTHTSFCDGKNTPEEIVLRAISDGFSSIGFSGHGFTEFDISYCMKDTDGYISEINRLKEKYKEKIQIYLGIEEDAFAPVCRKAFDYVIGSSHYVLKDGEYYAVDSGAEYMQKCIEVFDGNVIALADSYYKGFCDYISNHKPDIIGHFDLITKFDEQTGMRFLENKQYLALSEKYVSRAAKENIIFEVNTGAISRGMRTTPYPYENLLYTLKKLGAGITLSSDSHSVDTLSFGFSEAERMLKDIGFTYVYKYYDGGFVKSWLI